MTRGDAQRATVRLAARAKVNLRLHVLAREASGFHQIETVFCALDFADDIEIAYGGEELRLEVECVDNAVVPTGRENLVYRAAEAFFEAAHRAPGATIRLKKRIPAGSGLGGGSSDAATTLKGLNLLARQPLDDEQLVAVGAAIGSDVPFFLCGSSFALAWGRGTRLLPLRPLPPVPALLAIPPFAIETRNAYQSLTVGNTMGATRAGVIQRLRLESWEAVQQDAVNDFEAALFPKYPLLPQLTSALREAGATTALLSGSGSSVFGLFQREREAARASKRIRESFPDVRTIETSTVSWTGR
jgi:4-diphosphocytidyl-2-C-methyl-D-erythritol kinase